MTEERLDRERIDNFFKAGSPGRDNAYIEDLFCDDSKDKQLKKILSEQFYEPDIEDDDYSNERLDQILHTLNFDIRNELSAKKTIINGNFSKWIRRIAAILLLPVIVYAGVHSYREVFIENETWIEIKAPAWTRVQFTLPDGSSGWLNSNSSVRYRANFLSDRQVDLEGEAFFNVTNRNKKPFAVNTNEVNITVLGTRFNVSAYPDERNVEVVLEEGMLLFSDNDMKYSQLLSPNDLLVYDKDSKSILSEVVKPKKYLSWTEGTLVFRNDPIDVVARRLGRWYNADVELKKDIDSSLRLRATFVDEGLEEVMKILKLSLPIDFRIEAAALSLDSAYSKKKVIIFSDKK